MYINKFVFLAVITLFFSKVMASDYPRHWWKEIPQSEAKWWEVLPQDAAQGEVILSKRNELGILSNFAHTPFTYDGRDYQSVEGFWQSLKYPEGEDDERSSYPGIVWKYTREEVEQMTGFRAKKAGGYANFNMREMKIDWVTLKDRKILFWTMERGEFYDLIKSALRAKIDQNPKVKKILLMTGDLVLRADHRMGEGTPPAWKYNEIYMELRAEYQ